MKHQQQVVKCHYWPLGILKIVDHQCFMIEKTKPGPKCAIPLCTRSSATAEFKNQQGWINLRFEGFLLLTPKNPKPLWWSLQLDWRFLCRKESPMRNPVSYAEHTCILRELPLIYWGQAGILPRKTNSSPLQNDGTGRQAPFLLEWHPFQRKFLSFEGCYYITFNSLHPNQISARLRLCDLPMPLESPSDHSLKLIKVERFAFSVSYHQIL